MYVKTIKNTKNILLNLLILTMFTRNLNSMEEAKHQPETYMETLPIELQAIIKGFAGPQAIIQLNKVMYAAVENIDLSKVKSLLSLLGEDPPKIFLQENYLKAVKKLMTSYEDADRLRGLMDRMERELKAPQKKGFGAEQKNRRLIEKFNELKGDWQQVQKSIIALEDIIKLLALSIDITKKDAQGRTLLINLFKSHTNNLSILGPLFLRLGSMSEEERKAYINIQDSEGKSALMYIPQINWAIRLIELDASVNLKDNEGKTVLHHLSDSLKNLSDLKDWFAQPEVKKVLLSIIDERDNLGRTALMIVTKSSPWWAYPRVKLLLENGANPNIADNEGKTALDYIKRNFDQKQVDEFMEIISRK